MLVIVCEWETFTEKGYRYLLGLAKERYRFIAYTDSFDSDRIILWRHDVDASIHRGLRLAQIENDLGVKATYFLQLSSTFYNLFEHEIIQIIQKIINLGHQIGLHFDPSLYDGKPKDVVFTKMAWEKTVLENLLDTEIQAVSFHNPEFDNWLSEDQHVLCGMVNTYSRFFKENFGYCSDSNGYWRFDSIESVIRSGKHSLLQVLTHPAWWTTVPMPPRKRIQRCVDGRAQNCLSKYDETLRKAGRENIDD